MVFSVRLQLYSQTWVLILTGLLYKNNQNFNLVNTS